MRIVAYNFLSGGSAKRTRHWSRLVRQFAPDVILAQECRPPEESHAERFRPAAADSLVWEKAPARRWGSGVFVRSAEVTPVIVPDYAGWVVGGDVRARDDGARSFRVFSLHVPAGAHGYVRTMHEILDRIAAIADDADLILGGDFNVVTGWRQANERLKVSRGERGVLERLTNEFRLMSCWQAANPGRRLAQTLRWSADREAPYHCDGIFIPAHWLDRLRSCRVVRGSRWKELSDHNPVLAELTGSPGPPATDAKMA